MSDEQGSTGAAGAAIESPPKMTVVETPAAPDPRRELEKLASEVAKRGSRKLLWDYLRLRSRVMGK